jgi:hypothetical protein
VTAADAQQIAAALKRAVSDTPAGIAARLPNDEHDDARRLLTDAGEWQFVRKLARFCRGGGFDIG